MFSVRRSPNRAASLSNVASSPKQSSLTLPSTRPRICRLRPSTSTSVVSRANHSARLATNRGRRTQRGEASWPWRACATSRTANQRSSCLKNVVRFASKHKDLHAVVTTIAKELGYFLEEGEIDTLSLGIPQSRARWYCVGIRLDRLRRRGALTKSLPRACVPAHTGRGLGRQSGSRSLARGAATRARPRPRERPDRVCQGGGAGSEPLRNARDSGLQLERAIRGKRGRLLPLHHALPGQATKRLLVQHQGGLLGCRRVGRLPRHEIVGARLARRGRHSTANRRHAWQRHVPWRPLAADAARALSGQVPRALSGQVL